MVTKAEVLAAAIKASAQDRVVLSLSIMNIPLDPEKKIEQSARYRMAVDEQTKLHQEYTTLFDQWYAEGMPE